MGTRLQLNFIDYFTAGSEGWEIKIYSDKAGLNITGQLDIYKL